MKTNSKKNRNEKKSYIEEKLSKIPLAKLSKESKFSKRRAKKIRSKVLLISFFMMISRRESQSYQNWATKISWLIKKQVSKQALWKKMNQRQIVFLKKTLSYIMKEKLEARKNESIGRFNNIIMEDSTSIKLNPQLSKTYPGNRYGSAINGVKKVEEAAILKIQTAYNITKRKFLRFETTSFRVNDQEYSGKILEIAKRGDLIIRDLGYFSCGIFKKLTEKGIFYISRLRKRVSIYQGKEEQVIDLAKMLRKRGTLDIEVIAGAKEQLPARLIALPVDEQTANQRRRKARQKRDTRLNPTKQDLYLMGWEIFITNVSKEELEPKEIIKLYFLRWRIEIIFKTWKSYFRIIDIPRDANIVRTESYIYCMLIYITLFQVHFYNYYLSKQRKVEKTSVQQISMMRLMKFITDNIEILLTLSLSKPQTNNDLFIFKQIEYYCFYESRRDRMNFEQKFLKLS